MERVLMFQQSRRGFSLLEMLLVISILVVLLTLGSVAINAVLAGSELQRAGGDLQDIVARARQIATSREISVEVRFYQEPVDGQSVWNAFQIWATEPGGTGPQEITRYQKLPGRLAVDPDRSPLLVQGGLSGPTNGEPSRRSNAYRGFRFRTDGSLRTTLDMTESYLTVLPVRSLGGDLPANYLVLQVSPQTGRAETYQP